MRRRRARASRSERPQQQPGLRPDHRRLARGYILYETGAGGMCAVAAAAVELGSHKRNDCPVGGAEPRAGTEGGRRKEPGMGRVGGWLGGQF